MSSTQAAPPAGASALFAPSPDAAQLAPELMQSLVDQAATLNIYSRGERGAAIAGDAGARLGFEVVEALHRFQVTTRGPAAGKPLVATNVVGERVGTFTHRWLFAPNDFHALPDQDPPPTPFNPGTAQRFVMLDSVCRFGDGEDGFRGFGAGSTLPPAQGASDRVLVTAVGSILEGFGRFRGHEEGTYVYCGTLSRDGRFSGNILLRVADQEGAFESDGDLPDMQADARPEPDATYILFRGQAVPSDSVTPTGTGLIVEQGLRLFDVDFMVRESGRIRASGLLGRYFGKIIANINFNPAYPGGSAVNPIPFTNKDEFVLEDESGARAGSFTAESSEGRVFLSKVGDQAAIRFGGVGKILAGQGPFAGISGLMTDNSLVVFAPHVSASVYVLRIDDPEGRFRARS